MYCTGTNMSLVIKMPSEPDLSSFVDSATDRLAIRNIIYTAWGIFNSGSCGAECPYRRWDVQKMAEGRGYSLQFHFPHAFRIALSDMLALQDACPLRIDSIFVKPSETETEGGGGVSLCISVLNGEQPVQLTEMEVVRIRKRSRGLLGSAREWFSTSTKKK